MNSRNLVAVVSFVVALSPSISNAGPRGKVSVDFKDAAVGEVIAALEETAGRRIDVTPAIRGLDTISIKLSNAPVEDVITQILRPLGYSWAFRSASLESEGIVAHSYLVIDTVVAGSPAERAGLKKGDVITEVNGIFVTSRVDASNALSRSSVTPRVRIVRRDALAADASEVIELKQ
jgi:membrane-associated protease RseP (regulator of RpoE activity)